MKMAIYIGIGFVIACVLAVKAKAWFSNASTKVTNVVDNVVDKTKDAASGSTTKTES